MTLFWTAFALLIALGLRAGVAPEGAVADAADTGSDAGSESDSATDAGDESSDVEDSDEPGDDDEGESADEGGEDDDHVTDESDAGEGDDESDEAEGDDEKSERTVTLNKDLITEAKVMGFTDDEISQFGTDADLQRALNFHARKYLSGQGGKQTAQADAKAQDAKPPEQSKTDDSTKPEAAGRKPPPVGDKRVFERYDFKVNPEVADPEIVDVLNGIRDDYDAKIENLGQAIVALFQKDQLREDFSEFDEFDRFIEEQGPEWEEVLGKGPRFGLDPNSDAVKNRLKILEQARNLRGLYGGRLPRKQLFNRALAAEFFDKTKQVARKEISKEIKDRSKQRTHRPTSRQPAPLPPGKDKAEKFVRDFLNANG